MDPTSVLRRLGLGAGGIAAAAMLAMAAAAPADPPVAPAAPAAPVLRPLTVPAPPDRKTLARQVDTYVSEITRGPDNESVLLWNEPICPLVAGLVPDQGEAMLRRFSRIALAAGAPLGPRRCQANLYVIVASQPDRLLAAWRRRDRGMFGVPQMPLLERFLTSSRPVRVWYNAGHQGAAGAQLVSDPTQYGGAAQVSIPQASRLEFFVVRSLRSVILVVDAGQVKGFTVAQLGDYVSMLALTHVDPDADLGAAPTILRLFTAPDDQRPDGLTRWDTAFLHALYHSDQGRMLQRSEVTGQVVSAVTH